jgi:hypothetical protein
MWNGLEKEPESMRGSATCTAVGTEEHHRRSDYGGRRYPERYLILLRPTQNNPQFLRASFQESDIWREISIARGWIAARRALGATPFYSKAGLGEFRFPGVPWLNQVERWFAALTEKQVRRDVHCSTRNWRMPYVATSTSAIRTRNPLCGPRQPTKSWLSVGPLL